MKYVAKPVEVEAYVIDLVAPLDSLDGSAGERFDLNLEGAGHVMADEGMTSRMVPKVGDYWVIQSDGYCYLNPKEVFERKYHPKVDAFGVPVC